MQNISSDLQTLMEQANSDQASRDDDAEKHLAEQRRQQQLAKIVNPVRFFTADKMVASLGREATMEEFCNEWAHRWIACMEELKAFGIGSIPENWTDLSDRPAKQYAIGLFELGFANELEELTKMLTNPGRTIIKFDVIFAGILTICFALCPGRRE